MRDVRRRSRWLLAGLLVLLVSAGLWALATGGGAGPEGGEMPTSRSDDGSPAVRWTGRVVVDSGPGHVGPWRMNRSDWRYVDDPAVALDAEGGAAVAWVDQARKDVLFQRFGPEGEPRLPDPVNVSGSPGVFSWLPTVLVPPGDSDRVYLLWQEIVFSGGTHGGEAFFARSTDGGRTFAEPINLSETEAGAGKGRLTPRLWHNGSLDLALGPGGALYAAWTVYEGGLFLARSSDGGAGFSEPTRVTASGGGGEPARGPSLAAGPGGTVHLAWAVGGDPSADLRYAASADGGRSFGDPLVLFEGPGHADAPALAAGDGGGTLHLAWAESPEGPGGAYRIRYARAGDAGPGPAGEGAFGEPRRVSGGLGEEVAAGARFPSLALDGEGDPHLTFELYPRGRDQPRGLGYTASADGGRSFAGPAVVPGTADPAYAVNGSLQGRLAAKLDASGAGRVAVVNSGFQPGEASRVLLVLGEAAGR